MNNTQTDNTEAVRSSALLDLPGGDFDSFIGQCENLAEEMERKNPFDACGDGERVRKLIGIAKARRSNVAGQPTRHQA